MKKRTIWFLLLTLMLALNVAMAGAAEPGDVCGEKVIFPLTAGQTIDVGRITVANTETDLIINYQTTGDWYLQELHLYVLDYEPTERLTPGQAPHKVEGINTQNWTLVIPLGEIECGSTIWLQAHASVARIVDGEIVQSETAYGGDIHGTDKGSWYGNIAYTVQCCEEEKCYEFADETAWADGSRYVKKGNWATFTPYVADSTVTLFAGQTMNVGSVHFSAPVDGMVTITVNLTGDWVFAPVSENVKIQDYAEAPSGNPAPGRFAHKGTADGQSFSIQVPENNFYGVHVDVGYWMEVACPVE